MNLDPRVTHRYIQYVGAHFQKRDNLTGSGLTWEQGQVHVVNPAQAEVLLRHPLVFREVDEAVYKAQFGGASESNIVIPWEKGAEVDKTADVDPNEITPAQFAKLTITEIGSLDYNQYTIDQAEAFMRSEMDGKERAGAIKILSDVIAAKYEGVDTNLDEDD